MIKWHSTYCRCCEYCIFSGGTQVTVYGSHLDSVAEPRITLTVITTRFYTDTDSTSQVTRRNRHSQDCQKSHIGKTSVQRQARGNVTQGKPGAAGNYSRETPAFCLKADTDVVTLTLCTSSYHSHTMSLESS